MPILHWIETYRYIGLFILLALEYFILIVPGETELTTAGVLAHHPAYHLNIPSLILATGLGTFTGSMIAYIIGRLLGRPFLLKYGKYVFLTPQRLDKSERLFQKYTIITLILSRYIAFVRDIVPYVAGINRIPLKIVAPTLFIASFLWTSTFILAGNFLIEALDFVLTHSQSFLIPAIFLGLVAIAAYIYLHRKLKTWSSDSNQDAVPDKSNSSM